MGFPMAVNLKKAGFGANRLFHPYAHEHIETLNLPLERDEGPLPVPATSIYTPLDGIVAWRTCLDAENIAVFASHLGIANYPAALWAIADRLAQPADDGNRFNDRPCCGRPTQHPGADHDQSSQYPHRVRASSSRPAGDPSGRHRRHLCRTRRTDCTRGGLAASPRHRTGRPGRNRIAERRAVSGLVLRSAARRRHSRADESASQGTRDRAPHR